MTQKQAIGILAGMGPEASAYMYDMLIRLSVEKYGAKQNHEFPEIILHSIPVPDFISTTKEKENSLKMLQHRVLLLNQFDLSCMSIACNTAHIFIEELQEVSRAPFISMIDVVVEEILADGKKKVGLIGTPVTTKMKLYQDALAKHHIETIIPTTEQINMQATIIRNVVAGQLYESDRKKLQGIADSLKRKGAEGIILGCTELPLVFPKTYELPVYNSVELLAEALLQKYYK